jgi:hypothetical protein
MREGKEERITEELIRRHCGRSWSGLCESRKEEDGKLELDGQHFHSC